MARTRFLGSSDPNAVILREVIPNNPTLITTPFRDRITRRLEDIIPLVFEGDTETLEIIEKNSKLFIDRGWRLGSPLHSGDRALAFFRDNPEVLEPREELRVEVFEAWHLLSRSFSLSNRMTLQVKKHAQMICDTPCVLFTDRDGGYKIEAVQGTQEELDSIVRLLN